jgi:predicted transcriptional regulator
MLLALTTLNRMALVQALTDAGVVSIREAARRVSRDVRAVHSDVTALLELCNVGC